jgi:hypothetical protein
LLLALPKLCEGRGDAIFHGAGDGLAGTQQGRLCRGVDFTG